MYLFCGVMLASLAISSQSTQTEIDRNICPVGFPGTVEAHIKSSFFRKVKSTIMICEHDSDCPNGKCCGILGENICLYFRDHQPNIHPPNTNGNISNLERFRRKFLHAASWSSLERPEEHKGEDGIAVEHVKKEIQEGKCLNKTGNGLSRKCDDNGLRWRYVFFVTSLSGLFAAISFVSFTVCCKNQKDLEFWETVVENEIGVAAIGDPHIYKIADDKKIVEIADDKKIVEIADDKKIVEMADDKKIVEIADDKKIVVNTPINQTEHKHVTEIGIDAKREIQA